jgi:phosphoglycerate kinase
MQLRSLSDLELTNKRVFLRLDLNVPTKDGKITDETRIVEALPTIQYLLKHTNRICMASHMGRPKGGPDPKYSLEPVGARLAALLNKEVVFVRNYVEEPVNQYLDQLSPNQVVLLENLRFHDGEKDGDQAFAQTLMRGIDVYVNDGFGAVHRADASVSAAAETLPPAKRAAGLLIQKEVAALTEVMAQPKAPFTVVMGGAKVSDKVPVILNLITKCNNLLIGGAMAYTFLKAKGVDVGASKYEADQLSICEKIFTNAESRKVKIFLPVDHICATEFSEKAKPVAVQTPAIGAGLMGLDIGPSTREQYRQVIEKSATVLWNGPMGVFEWPAFAGGSLAVAKALAETKGKTIVGGGDSVSALNQAGVADRVSHVSTGGGASLEFLEGKTLPGLKVLAK